MTVRQAFEQEQPRLFGLPDDGFPTEERKEVVVGKTPYIRFDLNDYSVPHKLVRRTVQVRATTARVRVLDGMEVVADHERSFDQGQQVEDQTHIQGLVDFKQRAHENRSQDRVLCAVPQAAQLLQRLAERGGNLGSAVAGLGRLLDHYGPVEVGLGVAEALAKDVPHVGAVRHMLECRRHGLGLPPPVAVVLPDKPELRNLHVRPHDLGGYDRLTTKEHIDE